MARLLYHIKCIDTYVLAPALKHMSHQRPILYFHYLNGPIENAAPLYLYISSCQNSVGMSCVCTFQDIEQILAKARSLGACACVACNFQMPNVSFLKGAGGD